MSDHLAVHKHIAALKGFAQGSADEWLTETANEIERLVNITYQNFLTRGDQLESAQKRSDELEAQLKLAQTPTPQSPEEESADKVEITINAGKVLPEHIPIDTFMGATEQPDPADQIHPNNPANRVD